jgi:hypothetical protein
MTERTNLPAPAMHRTYMRTMYVTAMNAKKELVTKPETDRMVEVAPHEYVNQDEAGVPANRLLPPEW